MRIIHIKLGLFYIFVALFFLFIFPQTTQSCDVPVFRYALERWQPDLYHVFIFHQGEMTHKVKDQVEELNNHSVRNGGTTNFEVNTFNVSDHMPEPITELWQSLDNQELPCTVVCYPGQTEFYQKVWDEKLNPETVNKLLFSNIRNKISESLINGDIAVWIFLESGHAQKDKKALQRLKDQIAEMEANPSLFTSITPSEENQESNNTQPPARFTIFHISKSDQTESFFKALLLNSEPDLLDYTDYPMAFPIYGQGRMLYALVGDGISEPNIREACSFLSGPCSCEIKALNQGQDLLMTADWANVVSFTAQIDTLPALTGFSDFISSNDATEETTVSPSKDVLRQPVGEPNKADAQTDPGFTSVNNDRPEKVDYSPTGTEADGILPKSNLIRNILLMLCAGLGFVFVFTILVKQKKNSDQ